MVQFIEWQRFLGLYVQAMSSGKITKSRPHAIEVDYSMGCEKPHTVELQSAPVPHAATPRVYMMDHLSQPRWIILDTPCRKCGQCLRNRRTLWRKRARYEIDHSVRTWFCTFTISPEWRFRFSLQSGSMDYLASYSVISKELTKYWKRLRKAGFQFRYLMVAEAHKDGYPHIHAFIHEVSAPIPKRRLQAEWPYGFTNMKLVKRSDPKAVWYVAKYLSKDARTRVRASLHYGEENNAVSVDLSAALVEHPLRA